MPMMASAHSRTGTPDSGRLSSRRRSASVRVGSSASSHSTISAPVADVDHGSETATAMASPSATFTRRMRHAPAANVMGVASAIDRPTMTLRLQNLPGFAVELRQSAARAHVIAAQHVFEPAFVLRQVGAIGGRVPQMQHAGGKAPVLAPDAGVQEADD